MPSLRLAKFSEGPLALVRSAIMDATQALERLDVAVELDSCKDFNLETLDFLPMFLTRNWGGVPKRIAQDIDKKVGHHPLIADMILAYCQATGHTW